MGQAYHSNAKTNEHSRGIIQKSNETNRTLSQRFGINEKTVSKWRNRDCLKDESSKPNKIRYTLTALEKEVVRVVRTLTWMSLDDLTDTITANIPNARRSNIYRTLKIYDINNIPIEQKAKAKKFKEYEPGYLHIDVTYLPKFDKQKYYLFVAIDRATRLLYYKMYENKSSDNAVEFLKECNEYFPFYISHVLTDNGLEFTDKFVGKTKEVSGNHKFDMECKVDKIKHRLTAPYTPQTNGMVERVNGTIKNATIKAEEYANIDDIKKDLDKFLLYYNFNRRHGSLGKELKVRTPFEAVQSWFLTKPEIFKISPEQFQAIAFEKMVQRCET